MKKLKILLLFLFSLFTTLSYGQILKGTGLVYTNGVPAHVPRTSTESEYAVDVSTGKGDLYLWNRTSNTWKLIPEGIEIADNALVPSGAPAYGQSRFRVNNVPTLYFWTGITWIPLTGNAYTAGTGINITGNVITNTGDLSNTNEIQYIDTLRLTGSTLEMSLFNDALPLKSVSLGSLATNIYTSNGSITNQNRTVTIPGNLFFTNNTASSGENFNISFDNGVSSSNVFKIQEGQGISLISSENGIFIEGATSFRDVLATSTLTGNVNNYTGLNGGNVGILSSNGNYNITGIDGGFNGRILFIFNNGNFDLTFTNQDALSDTENQFYIGSDYILKADTGSAILMYDTLIPAWRIFKFASSSGGAIVNIYNSDGTIAGTRNVEVNGILNFNDADADAEINITSNNLTLATAIENVNIITPTALSANTDNWNPTGLNTAYEIRISSTGKFNLTGIVAQNNGREILLRNTGLHPITLKDNVTSTAANRFSIGADYNLRPNNHAVKIVYDDNIDRWVVEGGLSLGTGSGRIAGGRNQNVLWSYQTDTLMDFGLGYLPVFPSDPTSSYGSFGLGIDGDLGFEIQGKETYIIGTSFDLLKSSNVNAGANSYQLESRSRTTVGGVSNSSYLYGAPTANQLVLLQAHDLYQLLDIGSKKVLTGVPQTRTDYNYIFQGGGETGSDTSGISMWLGQPQYSDTTNSMSNGVRAVSKERGWGVQSLFNSTIGVRNTNAFDWIKITTGITPSDTTLDAIRFYGNKYEIPNQTPSSSAGDSSVIVWTSPFNSFFIDIDDIKGGSGSGVNIFNSDGTQDDADRLFTQDSTRTFAMGQFSSVSTPTWGRGYYYDPSTANGIRLLNKNGSNTTTSMVELDPETINLITTHTTATSTVSQLTLSESSAWSSTIDRTSDTYGSLIIGSTTNSNEEIIGLKHNGKADIPAVSMYLGDGYASSQYGLYTSRAWGVQTHVSGGFDWLQVLLPNTATDTTGNNLSFYNRKYYWSNESPSFTNLDTMVHVWIGNGTNATPDFVNINNLFSGGTNIYNSNGTTTQNTRNVTITETLNFIGTASAGVDPYPFQIKVTGTEPYIQLWKGNTDSAYLYQSDAEYVFGASSHLVIQSDDYVVLQGDSIQAQTIAAKTKIRSILGLSPVGTIQQFDGNAASSGDILASDGTDWVITTPTALGYVLQNGNSFGAAMAVGTNDNNVLNFETNNTTGLTLGTDQHLTATSETSNTSSVTDRFTIITNSAGTPSSAFGGGILFKGESTTTVGRDMGRISSVWTSAVDATRTSILKIDGVSSGSALTEYARFTATGLTFFNTGVTYSSSSVSGSSYLIQGTSTSSALAVNLQASGNNTNASGSIGATTFTTTSGTKYDWRMTGSYAPTSGTGKFYNLRFNPTINQTGGANGVTGGIIFEPTFTALGSKWSALTFPFSNSNALAINQTGSSSYSTHVGAFGFGSTTVPTDKVEVTGNVALLAAGNKLKIATGSNASIGTSGAMTAGTITVNTTAVTANSIILLTGIDGSTPCATCGDLSVGTITAGTSFVINSSLNTDTRLVNWLIIN